MAGQHPRAVYASNGWEIDLARRELRSRGVSVPIGSRAFEILEVLVRAGGELVSKYHLMDHVWPGAVVEENTLQFHISAIRKALGADRGLLKTVSGRGYRLLGAWTVREAPEISHPHGLSKRKPEQPYRTNVPVAGSALIGRSSSKQHLLDVLSAYRMVTLIGPGGIGKSVLALEVARSLFPTLAGDCWFVELASLADPALVPSTVASVLGLELGGREISVESIARAINEERLLLVLDNCEHLAAAAAGFAEAMIRMCPNVCVVATSREILRIEGEYVYRVPPLDVPPPEEAADINEYSAVRLFVARLMALGSGFLACTESLPLIASICRHLDGIPLAIEFAAARAATLGIRQIADGLNDCFSLLTAGRRTALPRHQTLRATFDWSYELLPDWERTLLRRLSVFAGGFTVEAATAVMGDTDATASVVLEGIASLVLKSLVVLEASEPSGRWRLLETTRTYALEKLAESGEAKRVARHHAEYFRDLLAGTTSTALSEPAEDVPQHAQEIDNIRAALDWAFSSEGDAPIGVALTVAFLRLWFQLSLLAECRRRVNVALASLRAGLPPASRAAMQLHAALGFALLNTAGPKQETDAAFTNALAIAEQLGDVDYQLRVLWGMWTQRFNNGENRIARALAERFLNLADRASAPADRLVGERLMGTALHYLGEQANARSCLENVLKNYAPARSQEHIRRFHFDQRVLARAMLARVLWVQGLSEHAMAAAQANLDEASAGGHTLSLCYALAEASCPIALMSGDLALAERHIATLINLAGSRALTFWSNWGRCLNGVLLIRRGDARSGSRLLRASIDALIEMGWAMRTPEFLGILAEGLANSGQMAEAAGTIELALAKSERDEELWCFAELLRIKGELTLQDSGGAAAEPAARIFSRALALARQQGAPAWELRAATSLARLMATQGRHEQSRQVLAPVYSRFTEGFETADLRSARAILETVSADEAQDSSR
ncbi:winged helix-turn-helix domain-containing protein [Bradyrhizobium sp. Ai1a-2]|uniref:ATP-binding protein n=1 Tax=Bradyrhizobium sp. Ai1a-2 TaxID=196490 RepID=UPI001FCB823B|nr:winged helix-turn-helix domain-containing protein [Bradyrhizobium sp. Ai1a-2]